MERMAADCPECGGLFMNTPHSNYDHVHGTAAARLPGARHTSGPVVTRGWATGMSGRLRQMWVFFSDPEPAYAFGRAGRMASAGDVTSFGVYEAAREVRCDEASGREVCILHVARDAGLREEHDDDGGMLHRWVNGCDPQSSYFQSARAQGR